MLWLAFAHWPNRLRTGPMNPDQAGGQMFQVANELEDLVGRVKRAAHEWPR